jgi:uncharacterized protein YerC
MSEEEHVAWAELEAAAPVVAELQDIMTSNRQQAAAKRDLNKARRVVKEVTFRAIRERTAAAAAAAGGGD